MIRLLILFELMLLTMLGVDRLVVNQRPLLSADSLQVLPAALFPATAAPAEAAQAAAAPAALETAAPAALEMAATTAGETAEETTTADVHPTLRRPASAVASVASSR